MSGVPGITPEYAEVSDVPVTLAIDPRSVAPSSTRSKFRPPDEIFSFDDTLERRIVSEYERREKASASANVNPRTAKGGASSANKQDAIKQLAGALGRVSLANKPVSSGVQTTAMPTPTSTSTPTPPEYSQLPPAGEDDAADDGANRQKSVELSLLYLPDDTEAQRELFCKIYAAVQRHSLPASDMEILRAYFLFEGDAAQAIPYLRAFLALRELGFPEDQISAALLLYKNDQEETLEHLMKTCS